MGLPCQGSFYIGPMLDSLRCFKLVKSDTKSQVISGTVKFCHAYSTITSPTPEDKIIHGLQVMSGTLRDAPPPTTITQVDAIANYVISSNHGASLAHCHQPGPHPIPGTSKGAQPGASKGGHSFAAIKQGLSSTSMDSAAWPCLCHPDLLPCNTCSPGYSTLDTFTDTPPPRVISPTPRVAIEPSHSYNLPPR